jgi:ATP-binding protein involved in chromosome partitioning
MSEKLNLPLLASIPLHMDVCTRGDFGAPIIVSDPFHQVSNIYKNLCLKLEKEIA